jgi:hypothetical protein
MLQLSVAILDASDQRSNSIMILQPGDLMFVAGWSCREKSSMTG